MKRLSATAKLAAHAMHPMRFSTALRGCEPLLRLVQLILLVWLSMAGAKLLAHAAVVDGGRILAELMT